MDLREKGCQGVNVSKIMDFRVTLQSFEITLMNR
jgi:hypothetical protein